MEKAVRVVRAYSAARGTLVLVVPKEARDELGVEKGDKFLVKIERRGGGYRLVYEPVK